MVYKTTDKDFTMFKSEVNKFINKFGLGRWYVVFELVDTLDENACAAMRANVSARSVRFGLSARQKNKLTKELITRCAIHEVAHLYAFRLYDMAIERNATTQNIEEEFEAMAVSMENAFFKDC